MVRWRHSATGTLPTSIWFKYYGVFPLAIFPLNSVRSLLLPDSVPTLVPLHLVNSLPPPLADILRMTSRRLSTRNSSGKKGASLSMNQSSAKRPKLSDKEKPEIETVELDLTTDAVPRPKSDCLPVKAQPA